MTWFSSFFAPFTLNPAVAAAGVGLIAAPIVIHLINRMRYRTVRFAAMEFLLSSQQKNRRRVLIEQLLLLLLRVLIVALLILLIARLILDPSALALIRSGAKTHHVVLLDDSGSMRNRVGDGAAFDAAKQVVLRFASETAREGGSQQLTVLLLSQAERNLALVTERDIDEELVRDLDTKLGNLAATHQALDLGKGLEAVRQRLLPERSAARQVHVVSDFRRADWLDGPALVEEVRTIARGGVGVNLVRVVAVETPNLAVTSLAGDFDTAAAGVPVRVRVGVTNFGETVAENVPLLVTQDKQRLPVGALLAKIEPGREEFSEFDVAFESPGRHGLRIEVADDALPADDRRFAAVDVAAEHPVLVIDGAPGQGDGAGLLADALAPAPGLSGLSPRVEPIDFLRRNPLAKFRAILLVNVPSLPADAVRALETYTRAGGGLCWFLGDAVQPTFYRNTLSLAGKRPDDATGVGAGPALFPVPLAASKTDRTTRPDEQTLDFEFLPVGRFAPFAGPLRPYWRGTQVTTYLPPAADWNRNDDARADGVRTVARLPGGDPLVLEHRFGLGKIVTVLTSAGQGWSNWPRQFVYVAFAQELVKELAERPADGSALVSGTPLVFDLPAAEFDPEIRIERPDGTTVSLRATPREQAGGANGENLVLHAVYADTDEPGVYKVMTAPASGGTLQETWTAINAPNGESRLSLADPAVLKREFAEARNVTVRDPGDVSWLRVREAGRDARFLLLGLLIALLVAEQALAYRLSYHPRTAAFA